MLCSAARLLAALRLAAAIATRHVQTEQVIEELETIAPADKAHAQHGHSKDQFQFHRTTSPLRVELQVLRASQRLDRRRSNSASLAVALAYPTR